MTTEKSCPPAAPRRWRRPIALLALAALAPGFTLAGCKRGGEPAKPDGQATPAKSSAIAVTAVSAKAQPISDSVAVTGNLSTLQDVTVGVKLAGRVVAIYPREGDRVSAGQAVAQQDTRDLQAQLDQQRANLESSRTRLTQSEAALRSAQAALNGARTNLSLTERQTQSSVKLAQAGLVSAQQQLQIVQTGARQQERQQAQEQVDAARANVNSAQADLNRARSDLKRYQTLYRQQAISAQQLDQAQTVADSAQARVNANEAALNQAKQALSLIQEGSRPEDIRRAQAAVEQAQQTLITAQANRSQVDIRRTEVSNAVANVASARSAIETSRAGVRQAEAGVRLAEQQLGDATVRSPINGVVAERRVEPGAQLGAGGAILRIVGLGNIFYDAQVSETQYSGIRVGQSVNVRVDALPGRTFRGTVQKLFPIASQQNRTFTVRISLPNEGNALRPEMFARGEIVLITRPDAVVVPREAVLDFDGQAGRVFVVDGDTAKERKVRVGFNNVQIAEITNGIRAGDKVVTTGNVQLQDGNKVQTGPVVAEQSAAK